jgi:hypothetical protein
MVASGSRTMIADSLSCIAGFHQSCGFSQSFGPRPARDAGALAQGWFSPLLALENELAGRSSADPDRAACADTANEHENPLWGAPRIHGELLKFGFQVALSSVAKYMAKRRGPPGQGWCTFLRNHAPDVAAMDLFVVPTVSFDLLHAFVIVRLDRRDLV